MMAYFGFWMFFYFIVMLCYNRIWTVGNIDGMYRKDEAKNSGLVLLFPSSLFLLVLLRRQSSQQTLSLQARLPHRPSRDWRTRTDFSHRFHSLPGTRIGFRNTVFVPREVLFVTGLQTSPCSHHQLAVKYCKNVFNTLRKMWKYMT